MSIIMLFNTNCDTQSTNLITKTVFRPTYEPVWAILRHSLRLLESHTFEWHNARMHIRKIIHVDMDAFYAAVEVLDKPALKGRPLVIGGSPNSRGVVCTASYEARKFGIRSAMACSVAYRKCPQAIFLPPRFERYQEISGKIREIFHRYTELVEPLSLDEAYLDVTDNALGLYATQIARRIKEDIRSELGLTCSAGVAPNKLVAKIASDFRKPDGLVIVLPEQVESFMKPLPVRKIHGVGPATEARLANIGIKTCADVDSFTKETLKQRLGRQGAWIWHAARGEDDRPVETHYERKSFGREDTFPSDLLNIEVIQGKLRQLSESVSRRMERKSEVGKTITLKVKYCNFETITRSRTIKDPVCDADTIFQTAFDLMQRKTDVGRRPIRLIGVSVSK